MLEFIRLIDVDYAKAFTCQLCAQLPHDQLVFIIDGKEMGMNRAMSKPYVPPASPDDAPVPVQWCAFCHQLLGLCYWIFGYQKNQPAISILACSSHAKTVPFPSQPGRTLLNRWAAALSKKGDVLAVLSADEWEDLLVHAAKLPGLADALRGVLERYIPALSIFQGFPSKRQ